MKNWIESNFERKVIARLNLIELALIVLIIVEMIHLAHLV
jgi:hypothetical protein